MWVGAGKYLWRRSYYSTELLLYHYSVSILVASIAEARVISGLCKVTGRRHRVSPCRSAYFASPWWLLILDLRWRSRETALLFPESWWHLMMRDSRPSLFMIIPNTKRHPHNTKTDQLRTSEVITGLPRPYHNTSWFHSQSKASSLNCQIFTY